MRLRRAPVWVLLAVGLASCGDPLVGGLVCAVDAGEAVCEGACADLTRDPTNCGACGAVCPGEEICLGGTCGLPCVGTEVQCGELCAQLETDRLNCGVCGMPCGAGEVCSDGMCGLECGGATPIRCGDACVDTDNNSANCGSCGMACAEGEVCSGGACGLSCGGATPTLCGDSCVDTASDRANCGMCGLVCAPGELCSDGGCTVTCGGATPVQCGFSCVEIGSNRNHCGMCDNLCEAGEVCSQGECGLSCGGDTGTQCGTRCVDTDVSRDHCGACDSPCAAGEICAGGACGLDCGGATPTLCGLSCVDTVTNRAHCGGCDSPCASGEVCSEGACAVTCGGTTPTQCGLSCTNTNVDPDNCGRCDTECASGESCVAGVCELSCGAATPDICAGVCVDVRTNRDHCGGCGMGCGAGEVCRGGMCELDCGGATPTLCGSSCVDTETNRTHCGGCGSPCAVGEVCTGGVCGLSCGGATPTQCGLSCTDTNTDEANCGSCMMACDPGESCVGGMCELTCGAATPDICDGACVNTQSNRDYCGDCVTACGGGQVCSAGACVASCGGGLTDCSGSCVNTSSDPMNCSACGATCWPAPNSTTACLTASCQYFCAPNFGDCDGDLGFLGGNGCETSLANNVANCGACGSSCGSGDVCRGSACVRTTSTTIGVDFNDGNSSGTGYSPGAGGLVLDPTANVSNFLWLVNTGESSVSKWDPVANRQVARYRVGLPSGECLGRCCEDDGCNMPSRVAVDGRGDAYIASQGYGMQGTVTKIATHLSDCIDRNGNGRIDTHELSTSPGALPFDTDECVLWTVPVGPTNTLLRALAIDGGDATYPQGYPWVGGFNTRQFWKLNPDTGAVIAGPVGVSINPFGALVVSDGNLFANGLGTSNLARIDTTAAVPTSTTVNLPRPAGAVDWQHFAMTADTSGRLWFSYGRNIQGYDPVTNQSTASMAVDGANFMLRGITVDGNDRIWAAIDSSPMRIASWDASNFVPGGLIPTTEVSFLTMPAGYFGASALGADANNILWYTNYNTPTALFRIDPSTGTVTTRTGLNRVFSFSDFTGGVRRLVSAAGTFEETFDGLCSAPTWQSLAYNVTTPAGTEVVFVARTADTIAGLNAAPAVLLHTTPPNISPVDIMNALTMAGVTPERYFRLTTILRGASGDTPVVRSYTVNWGCPS